MKLWIKIALVVFGIVIVAAVLIPFFVNANTFRPAVENQLTIALGRSVKVGDLKVSVFSGGLVAEDVSVADDPHFGAAPFLTAKELRMGVAVLPLLFSRRINLRSLQIEEPRITVVQAANGTWNFASIGHPALNVPPASAPASGVASPELASLSVGRIAIEDGHATVTGVTAHGQPGVYEHVNLTALDFSFGSQFPFEMSADLPAGGSIRATGHLGPINRTDAASSPVDAQISVKHLDPVRAGFLDASGGVSLFADIDMHAASDGQTLTANGTGNIQNLKLSKDGTASPKPLDVAFDSTHRFKDNTGRIKEATIKISGATIRASGTYQVAASALDNPLLTLKLSGQNLPIDALQPLIAAAAIRLPNGSTLNGGMLSFDLAAKGPAKSLDIRGPIALDNTQLVGFDIGSKIHGIAALAEVKTGNTSTFEKLSMDVHIKDAGVVVDGIDGAVAGLGPFTGSGTVSPTHQLDFHLLVQVAGAKSIAKIGAGLLAKLNGTGGSGSGAGVPMHVTGPSDNPSITAEVGGGGKKK